MGFGCRSSVDRWLRTSGALSHALTRWGAHNLAHIDNSIFIAPSKEECGEAVRRFKALCADSKVVLKGEKDAAPAQRMTTLGVEYDLIAMTRGIPDKRRADVKADLLAATSNNSLRH